MMVRFEENEYFLIAMFQKGSRQAAIEEIHNVKIRKYPMGISRCSPAMLWISRLLKTGRDIWRMASISAVLR